MKFAHNFCSQSTSHLEWKIKTFYDIITQHFSLPNLFVRKICNLKRLLLKNIQQLNLPTRFDVFQT